jgi:biopolymer transport protein ExbD
MARTFRRKHAAHPIADLNVTNLVDLAFTLLIVFMLAAPLIQPEQKIPVNLPVESVRPQPKQDPQGRRETVTVRPNGELLLGNRTLSMAELITAFQRFATESKPPIVEFRADANATVQHLITAMDEARKYNLEAALATRASR